jgi:hypothetical protein
MFNLRGHEAICESFSDKAYEAVPLIIHALQIINQVIYIFD